MGSPQWRYIWLWGWKIYKPHIISKIYIHDLASDNDCKTHDRIGLRQRRRMKLWHFARYKYHSYERIKCAMNVNLHHRNASQFRFEELIRVLNSSNWSYFQWIQFMNNFQGTLNISVNFYYSQVLMKCCSDGGHKGFLQHLFLEGEVSQTVCCLYPVGLTQDMTDIEFAIWRSYGCVSLGAWVWVNLGMGSVNERRRYKVTSFLIGWANKKLVE